MTVINTIEALAAEVNRRVSLCTIAQGAETDLAERVYEGRRHVSDDMIPCAAIIEAPDVAQWSQAGTNYHTTQRFVVYAWVPCAALHPNIAARAAVRDLKRALFSTNGRPDQTWGRSVQLVRYLGKDVGPRADGASFVCVAVEFDVQFAENVANP